MFYYYEDGYIKKVSMRKTYRMFITLVDNSQKAEGTTFKNWLKEMEHMQILNRIV